MGRASAVSRTNQFASAYGSGWLERMSYHSLDRMLPKLWLAGIRIGSTRQGCQMQTACYSCKGIRSHGRIIPAFFRDCVPSNRNPSRILGPIALRPERNDISRAFRWPCRKTFVFARNRIATFGKTPECWSARRPAKSASSIGPIRATVCWQPVETHAG